MKVFITSSGLTRGATVHSGGKSRSIHTRLWLLVVLSNMSQSEDIAAYTLHSLDAAVKVAKERYRFMKLSVDDPAVFEGVWDVLSPLICTYETKRFYKPDFVTSFLCPECGARAASDRCHGPGEHARPNLAEAAWKSVCRRCKDLGEADSNVGALIAEYLILNARAEHQVRFLCHSCHALEPRFRRLTKRKVARRARVCAKCRRGQPRCLVDCPQEKVETERKKLATMRDKRLSEGLPCYGCLKCRDVPAGCAKCRTLVHISSPFPHTSMLSVDLKQTVASPSL